MSKTFYSKEQTEEARNTNILEYLISKGEPFRKQGHYYRHAEHSSWLYDDRKKVMYFNKSLTTPATSSCVSAAIEVYGYGFTEAVGDILGSEAEVLTEKDFVTKEAEPLNYKKDIKHAKSFFHVYNYLVNEREIDPEVVDAFKKNQLIGEDVRQNIIFRYVDRKTNKVDDIVGVYLRGTKYMKEEERLIPDRPYYLFEHPGNEKDTMFYATLTNTAPTREIKVFEAGIDAMSYLSLHKEKYLQSIQKGNTDFCAMSGLKPEAVNEHFKKVVACNREQAKEERAIVPQITLCVDNDEGGRTFIERFKKLMAEKGYSENFIENNIQVELPESEMGEKESFDYNDKLKEHNRIKQLVNQQIQHQQEVALEN